MTQPTPPPPATIGTQPQDATSLNLQIGAHLRAFIDIKNSINQDHDFLAATTLTDPPYHFTADQETLIKSAIADLDTTLDGQDMTFISRIVGLY